jgi:hypothetical protein
MPTVSIEFVINSKEREAAPIHTQFRGALDHEREHMIIRDSLRCETCGTLHVVRIGMGQEERQEHRFPCRHCGEDIALTLVVDYENTRSHVVFNENATHALEEPGAKIVNLDANFPIPDDLQGVDKVFPRFEQVRALAKVTDFDAPQLRQRPDYAAEWKLLRKAWSLHRSGQKPLSRACIKTGSATYYAHDPLDGLPDWLWRFVSGLSGPRFHEACAEAMNFMAPFKGTPRFEQLLENYGATMAPGRGIKYFTLLNAYFNAYSEFAQLQFALTRGLELDDPSYRVGSADFDRVRMFYGNAFETLADMVDLLAFVNNIALGRDFDKFAVLSVKKYYELDKSGRFGPFAEPGPLARLCVEADNQLRNASHHNGMTFDTATQIITYRAGKGGLGDPQSISYTDYLKRCVIIFFETLNILLIELVMGQRVHPDHSLFDRS